MLETWNKNWWICIIISWEDRSKYLWNFEFDNLCSKFSYYSKQSLNDFKNQDYDIHDVHDVMMNKRRIMKKKCNVMWENKQILWKLQKKENNFIKS